MIGPRGGFTAYDRYLGWRGSCACGWVGPWRGSSLLLMEEDVMEHWGDCPERCRDQGKRGSERDDTRVVRQVESEHRPHEVGPAQRELPGPVVGPIPIKEGQRARR